MKTIKERLSVLPIEFDEDTALGTRLQRDRLGTLLMAPAGILLVINALISVIVVEGGALLLGKVRDKLTGE